jgi:hypothetical protein
MSTVDPAEAACRQPSASSRTAPAMTGTKARTRSACSAGWISRRYRCHKAPSLVTSLSPSTACSRSWNGVRR